jgi:hypothetical protein
LTTRLANWPFFFGLLDVGEKEEISAESVHTVNCELKGAAGALLLVLIR